MERATLDDIAPGIVTIAQASRVAHHGRANGRRRAFAVRCDQLFAGIAQLGIDLAGVGANLVHPESHDRRAVTWSQKAGRAQS